MRTPIWYLLIAFSVSFTLTSPQSLFAQDTSSSDSASSDHVEQNLSDWQRLIYLPYKNITEALDKQKALIFLPYQEYLELWKKSIGGMKPLRNDPAVSAALTESHYQINVEDDHARINLELKARVVGKPWAEIPLKFGSAAVGKVTAEDDRIILRGTGPGLYALLLPEQGVHTIQIELLAKITKSPQGSSIEMECPPVAITTVDVSVPEADQSVEMTPTAVFVPVETEEETEENSNENDPSAKQTQVSARLGATHRIGVQWHPRVGTKPDMDLLASVTNLQSLRIDQGLIHTHARLNYSVLRGELPDVRIAVPLGHRILSVTTPGAQLKSWKTTAETNRQVITVELLSSTEKQNLIEVRTEHETPKEAFSPAGIDDNDKQHGIHALDVIRESGQLAISYNKNLKLAIEKQQGVLRIDQKDADPSLHQSNALYYRYYAPKFELSALIRQVEPRLSAHQTARFVFLSDELRFQSSISYNIVQAGIFQLTVKIPGELEVDTVSTEGMKEYLFDSDQRELTVSFTQKKMGAVRLVITAHQRLQADNDEQQSLTLPLPELLNVERETGQITIYAPPSLEIITDESKLVGAYPEPQTAQENIPNARFVSAWRYNRRPVEIPARWERKPTRLSARVGTSVKMERELAKISCQLAYQIENAGLKNFRFQVPAALSDQLVINATGGGTIQERNHTEPDEQGWVTWSIVMQDDVIGVQRFQITYEIPYKLKAEGAEAEQDTEQETEQTADKAIAVSLEPLRVLGSLERMNDEEKEIAVTQLLGEIRIDQDRSLTVGAKQANMELEPIDIRELVFLQQAGSLAYRYFKQPVSLTIQAEMHEIQPVVSTVVSRALVEMVLNRTGEVRYHCRYKIKTSERQQLQLDLPAGAQLLGVSVSGNEVQGRKRDAESDSELWDPLLIDVNRRTSTDVAFPLSVLFTRNIDAGVFDNNGGSLELPMPRLGGEAAADVAMQELRSVIWIPDQFVLVGTPNDFSNDQVYPFPEILFESKPYLYKTQLHKNIENWIDVPGSGLTDFPTEGHVYLYSSLSAQDKIYVTYWHLPFLTFIISGALVLIALALVRTTWENKLTVILLLAFAFALYALTDWNTALHGLLAARYGLITALALWLIHALLGSRHSQKSETQQSETQPAQLKTVNVGSGFPATAIPPPGIFDDMH